MQVKACLYLNAHIHHAHVPWSHLSASTPSERSWLKPHYLRSVQVETALEVYFPIYTTLTIPDADPK